MYKVHLQFIRGSFLEFYTYIYIYRQYTYKEKVNVVRIERWSMLVNVGRESLRVKATDHLRLNVHLSG